MQRLWSRTPSAQSTGQCVSNLTTGATGIAARGATAASKRRFRFANSITAFYSSIFAAAALADARGKDKRRMEWDEKIAAVKEEVNILVDEEQRLLSAIESRTNRRAVRGGALQQTRSYSTNVPSPGFGPFEVEETEGARIRRRNKAFGGWLERDEDPERVLEEDASRETVGEEELFVDLSKPPPRWLSEDTMRQKAIRILALKQLAIRLVLRPSIAHNYSGMPMNYTADFETPPMNVPALLDELNRVRRKIRFIKDNANEPIDDLTHGLRSRHYFQVRREKMELDREVQQDKELYVTGQMHLQEFLLRLADNLLKSTDPDRPVAFKHILIAFSETRQNDLGELLLRTLLPNAFLLTSPLIILILNFLRKTKDLRNFDLFLLMLRGDDYSINLGKMPFFKQKNINGIDITVPPLDSSNPVLYSSLIAAALRFDQPERADAYFEAARATGFVDSYHTLYAYLKFYAVRKDWAKGVDTLKRAVAYLGSTSAHADALVERLIVWMVHFCDTCDRNDVSGALIKAAIDCGFDSTIAAKQLDITPTPDPEFKRWQKAAEESNPESHNMNLKERCFSFAYAAGEILSGLGETRDLVRSRQEKEGLYSETLLSNTLTRLGQEKERVHLPTEAPAEQRMQDNPDSMKSLGPLGLLGSLGSIVEETPGPKANIERAEPSPQIVQEATISPSSNNQNEEVRSLRRELEQLKQASIETVQYYRSRTPDLDAQREAIVVLQSELRETKKVAKIAKESNQSHADSFITQSQEICALKSEVANLRKNLSTKSQALEAQKATISHIRADISDIRRVHGSSKDATDEQRREIQFLKTEIGDLRQELESHKTTQKREMQSLRGHIAKALATQWAEYDGHLQAVTSELEKQREAVRAVTIGQNGGAVGIGDDHHPQSNGTNSETPNHSLKKVEFIRSEKS